MGTRSVSQFFSDAAAAGASDVHIVAGSPLFLRIDGVLQACGKEVTPAQAHQLIRTVLGEERWKRFQKDREIDLSMELAKGVRIRVNCHFERGNPGLVARLIPANIPSPKDLGLEDIAARIFGQRQGLVLFVGPTGSGKSTSLASLLHALNQVEARSIVTLEDPIEFMFPQGKGVIRQREYGQDFLSFPEALRRILRQNPDVVMVGEMRDPETIAAALTLAETGHLILATLHTPNAVQTVDRIIDVFPPHQQPQVRAQLALSLKVVIAQQLLPRVKGGRVALREVLVGIPAIANIIREGRAHELTSVLQTHEDDGMVTFEKAAKRLYKEGLIAKETYEAAVKGAR